MICAQTESHIFLSAIFKTLAASSETIRSNSPILSKSTLTSEIKNTCRIESSLYYFNFTTPYNTTRAFEVFLQLKIYNSLTLKVFDEINEHIKFIPPMLWFTFSDVNTVTTGYMKYMRITMESWRENIGIDKLIPVHVFVVGYDATLDRMITSLGGITFNSSLPAAWDSKIVVGFKGCFSRVLIQDHLKPPRAC